MHGLGGKQHKIAPCWRPIIVLLAPHKWDTCMQTYHLPNMPSNHSLCLIHLLPHTLPDFLLEQLQLLALFSHTYVNEPAHDTGLGLGGRWRGKNESSNRLQATWWITLNTGQQALSSRIQRKPLLGMHIIIQVDYSTDYDTRKTEQDLQNRETELSGTQLNHRCVG